VILLDTNVLLRSASATDADHAFAVAAIDALALSQEELCIVPQNVYEFWATATRPRASNGLGMTVAESLHEIGRLKTVFRFLPDKAGLFAEWEAAVVAGNCHGRVSFDARLVAAMRTHGMTRILTFNLSDFTRFQGIVAIDPHSFSIPSPPTTP
jgi:predicted nucleic acid-binding protein